MDILGSVSVSGVTLLHGDSRQVLDTLSGELAFVTDPPYGVEFSGKKTKHSIGGRGYHSGDDPNVGPQVVSMCVERMSRGAIFAPAVNAWDYPRPSDIGCVYCPSGAGLGRWGFVMCHPVLFYGKDPYLAAGMGHRPNSISSFATQKPNGHPCPKPLEWMKWLVRKVVVCDECCIVDPFAGSGTTLVACIHLGVRAIGIEVDQSYFAIAANRIKEAAGQEVAIRGATQKRMNFSTGE